MMKRFMAILLCVCLLLPLATTAGVAFAAEEGAKKEFVLREMALRISQPIILGSSGIVITVGENIPTLDITGYGDYLANIAVQVDVYISGDDKFVEYMAGRRLGGQLEITSSGECDVEEIALSSGQAFVGTPGEWTRVTIPLARLGEKVGGVFRPENLNYIRVYLEENATGSFIGGQGTIKLCNFCIVNLTVPESDRPTEEEFPIGDGSFVADPPVFDKMPVTSGYNNGEPVYAGYNLKEYLASHPEIEVADKDGKKDYTAVVNSLLDGLANAGGGTLFIPAGQYDFYGEIYMPDGTSIMGEWVNPDENPEARGTILNVYSGRGQETNGSFLTLGAHCVVQYLSFYYPEQSAENIVSYPPTIELYQYTFARNITLYNSYFGIRSSRIANCPNAWNIYGTPLNVGLDFDMVIDIARIEEIHFASKYWIESELPNAPTTVAGIEALENQLFDYAVAITLRRMDWSYVTYSDIKGYNTALMFAESADGNYPNGQCVGLNFTGCKYGNFSYGVQNTAQAMLDITMRDCEYGVYVTGSREGFLRYYDSDIEANQYAIYQDSNETTLSVLATTIRKGRVYAQKGNNIFINNTFYTGAPQIELDYGTVAGTLIGNLDYYGDPIEYTNPGSATFGYNEKPMELDPYTAMTREEAAARVVGPNTADYEVPIDIDITGATDATEKIQSYLTKLGKNGGGTLFLRPGRYRIEGTLTVPTGVEIRGAGDYASMPKAVNTIFNVYTKIEDGKDQYTSTATITLSKDSGLRGVIFNYPEQASTRHIVKENVYDPLRSKTETDKKQDVENSNAANEGREPVTVEPVEVFVTYWEYDWIKYPYAVRGTGEGVYLKYVTVRNGWNGVDFKTYRCDNHFIDYLAGHFLNRGIVIGGGSENGYVRNFQFNYNSILHISGNYTGWETIEGATTADFHQPMQKQFQNNSIILQLGNVNNQLVYNCFNYSSYIGVHLVEENGEAANARIFGHGVDYGTVSLKIEAAEDVEFTNMQLTSFNQAGDDVGTDRWAVEKSETMPLYDIWLTETFEGEVTITNFVEWASNPTAGVRVDSGKLNMYNTEFDHTDSHLFEVNGDGELNIIGFLTRRKDNPTLMTGNSKNLHITAGFVFSETVGSDKVGTYDHVFLRKTSYSVPKNVIFTDDSEIVYVESFDDFSLIGNLSYQANDTRYVSIRRGAIRMRLGAGDIGGRSFGTGQDRADKENRLFALESGKANDLYRMEWRLSLTGLRDDSDSVILLSLLNRDVANQEVFRVDGTGAVYDQNGNQFANVQVGKDYRVAVEVDARKADSKTVTVYLLNDASRVIGKGETSLLRKDVFQGKDNTVTGFMFTTMATALDGDMAKETDVSIDYFYITRSEESSIGRNVDPNSMLTGDVDGNGKVDSTDARLVLQYAVGKVDTLAGIDVADVNGDNKIDSTDARLILQYAVGKIDNF